MNKKFVYQVGNNKKVTLCCTVNQISRKLCAAGESSQKKSLSYFQF